ncbi:MAG TPA: translocation/assembly module TamB domain-containing protein [Bryobacteraceae bacterium]|nr:translocation/assembly module TamB domain-containing protein [Bryobacteraceae bacterium]
MRKLGKFLFFGGLVAIALAVIAAVTGVFVLRSDWFRTQVRDRIVSEVERSTGGRVEIGQFNYDWHALTASLGPFTLHGKEPQGAAPLFHADRIQIGLRIISALENKVDIASLEVDRPEVHVIVSADGSTNIPTPKVSSKKGNAIAEILDLKIQHFVLRNGLVEYEAHRMPLNARGDNLRADIRYLPGPPRYAGEIASKQVHLNTPEIHDAAFDFDAQLALEANRLQINKATVAMNRSSVSISGNVSDFASPQAQCNIEARVYLTDLASLKLPIERRGDIAFSGKASYALATQAYNLTGKVSARDLAIPSQQIKLYGVAVSTNLNITPVRIELAALDVGALGGHFRGSAEVVHLKQFRVGGKIEGISLQQLVSSQGERARLLSGTVTGPVDAEGQIGARGMQDLLAQVRVEITPGTEGLPIQGLIDASYDQKSAKVRLGSSNLILGSSHLDVSGTLGELLAVHLTSGNLDDFLALAPLAGAETPKQLPVKLNSGGSARFDGDVSGPLDNPRISGQVQLAKFAVEGRGFNQLSAQFDLGKTGANVHNLAIAGDAMSATGSGTIGLTDWKPTDASPISASVSVPKADVKTLLEQNGQKLPVTGAVSLTTTISGTYGAPQGTAHVEADNVVAYEEAIKTAQANLGFTLQSIEVHDGHARAASGEVDFTGAYQHPGADWSSGQMRFDVSTHGIALAQVQNLRKMREGIDGRLDLTANGTAHLVNGIVDLDTLTSKATVQSVSIDGESFGNLQTTAATRGQILDVKADTNARGTPIHGAGEWQLSGDYPGHGEITVPQVTLATLNELRPVAHREELPFNGFLSVDAKISGPLKKPDALQADVTIPVFQLNAKPTTQPRAGAQAKDLVLRNSRPILLSITTKGMDVKSAQFVGTDTTLEASGRVGFTDQEPSRLAVTGSANLAILQLLNPDLLATGTSTVNAVIRGPLKQPELTGRLELTKASLYLAGVPNGVDNANGVILFDRNRATIQGLSAETGGGKVTFQPGGFVGFSGQLLIYRVQATAERIRYRAPEGVSVTANAKLSLIGTSQSSVLSGSVSVVRAGFMPQTDIGTLLAATAKPIAVPTTPNEYLRGVQFDVTVDTAQSLEVITSLTRNIEAEANIRIRGNIEHPVVLGNISVNQGEIDFFGNKYSINRGEINFFNPARIEPIIDMDLETTAGGIKVDITFSGPLNKLNFSYRSDPPLETNQIIALLAVGRQPVTTGALASTQTVTNTNYLATGGNAILSEAISPATGRLQRLFGVSHIKIDPQLTDVTAIPQARLTLEQQISKDITFTYITNLSRTQEQIVRVEWTLNKQWSVVALRDENGQFSLDFQYRKRFK